jgi:PAS domain S-box-containing protein
MTFDELKRKFERLEKRLERERLSRAEAEKLLHHKSRDLYILNKRLNEEARLFEATITSAKDGIMITTADLDNGGPKIIYVNNSFTDITGYTKEEIIGKTPRILQGHGTDRQALDKLKETLKAGKPYKGQLKNYGKNGHEYWLDISIVPVKNEAGQVTHFAAIERDITQTIKDKEELKKQTEMAVSSSIAKSEFLANMSHELRTPMNAIIGMCEFLLDSRLDEDQRENAETLHNSSKHLLSILNNILDLSKIEAGEWEIESVPYHLETSIHQIAQLYTPIAQQKSINLKVEHDSRLPQIIEGDLGKIQQIMKNLISNALKFTENGHITVRTRQMKSEKDTFLMLEIEDTGIGIPANKRNAIFEKFTQADTSVTREFGGTGLGLAITQQLTYLMKGKIGVKSVEGEGSTFWCMIPLKIAAENAKVVNLHDNDTKDRALKSVENLRVLAVDDHPINQEFLRKLLTRLGFKHIDIANNGLEALNHIKDKTYNIVLMDCQMPVLDGYQAVSLLRDHEKRNETAQHLPVIALTANAMVGDREKCLKAGMDDYLSKPIKADKLYDLIQKHATPPEDNVIEGEIAEISDIHAIQEAITPIPEDHDTSPVIDMNHLNSFTEGDINYEQDLIDLFFSEYHKNLKSLITTVEANDNEEWKNAAHKLKGAAANLGATPLQEICLKAEEEAHNPEICKIKIIEQIEIQANSLENFFEKRWQSFS